jgi:hypothetical protein
MKIIIFFAVLLLPTTFTFCQQKGAEIRLNKFNLLDNGERYYLNCSVTLLQRSLLGKSYLIVFYMKNLGGALTLANVLDKSEVGKGYYLLEWQQLSVRQNNYEIFLRPSQFKLSDHFLLYPILIEIDDGYLEKIEKTLSAFKDEFYKIEDLLNFMQIKNFKPLTYLTIER